MKFSLAQLQQLAVNAGFPDPVIAAAVAMAESCGNTCAQGDPNIGGTPCNVDDPAHSCAGPNGTATSFGLWQIHVTAHPQFDPTKLLDPTYNAQAAYAISNGGTHWQPWTTYKTGDYQRYLTPFVPSPFPVMPAMMVNPPTARPRAPALLIAVGALALAGAAGYAAYGERRRRLA